MKTITAYKLFRVRKDGSLGSLFFKASDRIQRGKWLKAEAIHKEGFSFRPGWHACPKPTAPHLSQKGRAWYMVQLRGVTEHQKPAAQGGLWYTAKQLKVVECAR